MSEQNHEVLNQLDCIKTVEAVTVGEGFVTLTVNKFYHKLNNTETDNVLYVEGKQIQSMPKSTPVMIPRTIKTMVLKV